MNCKLLAYLTYRKDQANIKQRNSLTDIKGNNLDIGMHFKLTLIKKKNNLKYTNNKLRLVGVFFFVEQ